MPCEPGRACDHKLHELLPQHQTVKVLLSCAACGYVASARGGDALTDALRDHRAYAGCPASA